MWKVLLLLSIFQVADGFVQLYVVGVPNKERANINKTLAHGWCNAPVRMMQTASGKKPTLPSSVLLEGEHDSVYICGWMHDVNESDIGLYNFTGRRPVLDLGEMIPESWWGVDCKSCYNRTDIPFTDCDCGEHYSGCTLKCQCTGGWSGPDCRTPPKPKVDMLAATPPVSQDCAASMLCVISLLGNIFLLFILGWMLIVNRRRPKQELFLYHTLENPVPPRKIAVTEI
ncbi:MAG: NS7a [Bat faecal coronavirus]|nr:MAG: NS7a [Bat faecal coronavirus]